MRAMPAAGLMNFRWDSEFLVPYIIGMLVLFMSLSLHEFAHAWTADRLGDKTAREMGRLTLNPIRHMDPVGTLFILLGAPVGWARPVPFNPNRFDPRHSVKKGIALVSIAGALSNVILAFIAYFLYAITWVIGLRSGWIQSAVQNGSAGQSVPDFLLLFFYLLYFRNILLAIFNLLPIPPLDGFKFFGTLLPDRIYFRIMQYERYIGLVFIAFLIFSRGTLSSILSVLASPLEWLITTPINALAELLLR